VRSSQPIRHSFDLPSGTINATLHRGRILREYVAIDRIFPDFLNFQTPGYQQSQCSAPSRSSQLSLPQTNDHARAGWPARPLGYSSVTATSAPFSPSVAFTTFWCPKALTVIV
jgi:hypothetical protein